MLKTKYFKDKDPWMLAEDIPNIDPFFAEIWLSSFANELKNACGRNYKKILAVWASKFYLIFYYGKKDCLAMEKHLVGKMLKDPRFGRLINLNIVQYADELNRFSLRISRLNQVKLPNSKLADLIDESDLIHTCLYEWGWLANATDMFHGTYTATLKKYLKSKLTGTLDLNQSLTLLTSPDKKSVSAKQDEELLKIAILLKNKKNAQARLKRHWEKYFYLKYLWLGDSGVYTLKYFQQQAEKLAKDKIDLGLKIRRQNQELARIKKGKNSLFKKLKFSRLYRELFEIYADFMLTKIYRRYAQIRWAYEIGRLLKICARRLGISFDEIRYLTGKEIAYGLRHGGLSREALKKRLKYFWLFVEKDIELVSTDKNHPVLNFLKSEKKSVASELSGQVACLGFVRGKVRIINSPKDLGKMRQGDILVSIATNPDLVPAMKKAGAIVTEQGGVTSHAAIVSRELKIPCVIGTKIATKVFKDGDLVEVDANKGIVKKV